MRNAGCPSDEEVAGWFRWIAASLALLAMTRNVAALLRFFES